MSSARNYNAWLLERAWPYLGPRVLDVGAGSCPLSKRSRALA
jgi:hypothetical protein